MFEWHILGLKINDEIGHVYCILIMNVPLKFPEVCYHRKRQESTKRLSGQHITCKNYAFYFFPLSRCMYTSSTCFFNIIYAKVQLIASTASPIAFFSPYIVILPGHC